MKTRELISRRDNGQPYQSLENCVLILENDPYLSSAIRKNLLRGMVEITGPVWWSRNGTSITDTDVNYILLYLESYYGQTNYQNVDRAIKIAANENQFHPIRDYLEKLRWDGVPRIRSVLHHFLGAPENDLTEECMKHTMMGALERIYHPGCKFDEMLCFVGQQGDGKSSFFRFLAIKDEWFSDDLSHLNDKRVYEKLMGYWIIEMPEMTATANAQSIEEIKAFLSRQKENYRIAYDKYPEDRLRQCIFCGTANTLKFLPFDRTGNRRFIPVVVNRNHAETHVLSDEKATRAYIDQLWAEAMVVYKSGEWSLKFSEETEEQLNLLRTDCMAEDTMAGVIQAWLDEYQETHVCSMQLYKEALNHQFNEPKKWETNEINEIMRLRIRGWEAGPQHRFQNYGQQRSWIRCKQTAEASVPDWVTECEQMEMQEKSLPELPF